MHARIRDHAAVASRAARVEMRKSLLDTARMYRTATDRMVACAEDIVSWPEVHHGHGGRGPVEFDCFGLVRACAQAVVDVERGRSDILADVDVPLTEPGAVERVLDVIEGWGMRRVRAFDAEAGDIVIGRVGWPVTMVITENHKMYGGVPCAFAHAAQVWPGSVPAVRHVGASASTLFAAFTWRGTQFQSAAIPVGGADAGDEHPGSDGLAATSPNVSRQPVVHSKEIA